MRKEMIIYILLLFITIKNDIANYIDVVKQAQTLLKTILLIA